jgi:hypothetical protein
MSLVFYSPPFLEIYEIPLGREVELFRRVWSGDRGDAAFRESFMSNFATGKHPRGPENRSATIQMGLSMYEQSSQAEGTARLYPAIGQYVARLLVTAGHGINLASTGQVGHWTVWGGPDQLVGAVADVYPW